VDGGAYVYPVRERDRQAVVEIEAPVSAVPFPSPPAAFVATCMFISMFVIKVNVIASITASLATGAAVCRKGEAEVSEHKR
jgi:hypothetical protein